MHIASDRLDGSEEIEFTTAYDVFVRAGFEPTICGVELTQSSFATYVATRHRWQAVVHDSSKSMSIQRLSQRNREIIRSLWFLGEQKVQRRYPNRRPWSHYFRNSRSKANGSGRFVLVVLLLRRRDLCPGDKSLVIQVLRMSSQGTSIVKTGSSSNKRSFRHEGTSVKGFYWRRPGTALEWSLTMVELLAGKDKRDDVAAGMVLHPAIAWFYYLLCEKFLYSSFCHLNPPWTPKWNKSHHRLILFLRQIHNLNLLCNDDFFRFEGLGSLFQGICQLTLESTQLHLHLRCFRKGITFNLLFSSRRSLSSSSWGRFRDCSGLTGMVGWRFNFGMSFGTGVAIPSACSRSTIRNGS
jgi:protein DJ-1